VLAVIVLAAEGVWGPLRSGVGGIAVSEISVAIGAL
jgi:hypothetical protein